MWPIERDGFPRKFLDVTEYAYGVDSMEIRELLSLYHNSSKHAAFEPKQSSLAFYDELQPIEEEEMQGFDVNRKKELAA
jgi:hypothetical protein